ncbi:hypothetical protein J0H33_12195 [bacterium]|jgi:hypothetical protein|nr:hypothetical protein [bacterium]
MGFIGKLFGHQDEDRGDVQVLERPTDEVCLHTAAAPEWDNLDDMGKEDRVARFRCPACGEVFSASDYRRMQASDSERLAKVMEPGSGEES